MQIKEKKTILQWKLQCVTHSPLLPKQLYLQMFIVMTLVWFTAPGFSYTINIGAMGWSLNVPYYAIFLISLPSF